MGIARSQKELLGRIVARLESVAPYADALYMENRTRRITRDRSDIQHQELADAGVKIRAFDGQTMHEVAVQGWQPQLLQQKTNALLETLQRRPQRKQIKVRKAKLDKEFATQGTLQPIEQSIEQLNALHEQVMSHGFTNCVALYREIEERRVFVNRHEQLSSRWIGCTVSLKPLLRVGDHTRHDHFIHFAHGSEALDIDEEELAAFIARAQRLKDAKRIPAGKYRAILSPTLTGLLAHESFGHGMEADTIEQGRARAKDFLGKRIASAKVSICEDPSLAGTNGSLFFDDEGMLPGRTFLVERGIVRQPITDLLHVNGFDRTANGRAQAFDHKAYARMTNTFFLPGKDDPAKMLKSIKNGVYLHTASSGMEDPKGWGVQLAGILAERIKNGKLTGELYYEASMTGFLPDILKNISAVGTDFSIVKDAGFCGKNHKEWVRVASGGPSLIIDEVHLA